MSNISKTNGVKASAVDNNKPFHLMNDAEKAATINAYQAAQVAKLVEREAELNEAYKPVLERLEQIQGEHKGFNPYWTIPQGVAYKIRDYLKSQSNGKARKSDIIAALVEHPHHLSESQITDTLQARTGDGKNAKRRDMWQLDVPTDTFTLLNNKEQN